MLGNPLFPQNTFPSFARATRTARALALSGAAWALVGCGGGSGSGSGEAPPPEGLPAPQGFSVQWNANKTVAESFEWTATSGATRYELFIDPDGPGPLPEAAASEEHGFHYSDQGQRFKGDLRVDGFISRINAAYRLRACNDQGCGALSPAQAFQGANLAYNFSSGQAPFHKSSLSGGPHEILDIALSRDDLTLAVGRGSGSTYELHLFARSTPTHPWQPQAELLFGMASPWFGTPKRFALSADGATLAVSHHESGVQVYQRDGNTWNLQSVIDRTQVPATCPQSCSVKTRNLALSADGNLLAMVTAPDFTIPLGGNIPSAGAVLTYTRTGTSWAPQAYLSAEDGITGTSLALSGDGRTLAVNTGGIGDNYEPTEVPYIHIFAQANNGTWSRQARLPAGVNIYTIFGASYGFVNYSAMALSNDGDTLAINAYNVLESPAPELIITNKDLTCGNPWGGRNGGGYAAVYARAASGWSRQAVLAQAHYPDNHLLALAPDGNAIIIGDGVLFTRSNGAWVCP